MATIPLKLQMKKLTKRPAFWALPILALIAVIVIVFESAVCTVVVYNQTNDSLEGVQVTIAGGAHRFGALEAGESRKVSIPANAAAGAVRLTWVGSGFDHPQDFTFEPARGRQLVIRLETGDYVSHSEQESVWQGAFRWLR